MEHLRKLTQNTLINKNNHWYENGRLLAKKDMIFVYSSHDRGYILSGRTGQRYNLKQLKYE